MKINIVNYEQALGINGILSKYAKEIHRNLIDLGHQATISDAPAKKVDINHHLNYQSYIPSGTLDTVMITHLDSEEKIKKALDCLKTAYGICFNPSVVEKLIKRGAPKDRLTYVYHAHDSIPRRPRIIALAYKIYPDGRKREEMFTELFKTIKDKNKFAFRIMGGGWKPVLDPLVKKGLKAQWVEDFYDEFYRQLLATSDYLLYTGGEETMAQSLLDAKQAGLRIIAPPHEEIEVDLPFNSQEELNAIFAKLEENPVEDRNWENYAKQLENIWKKLCSQSKNTKK